MTEKKEDNESLSTGKVFDFVGDLIKDVSVANVLLGAVMGAVGGAVLSVVNQTLVNPPRELMLPPEKFAANQIQFLRARAPDLLYAIDNFYSFRRYVDKDERLDDYDKQAQILIDKSISIVAIYEKIVKLHKDFGVGSPQFTAEYPQLITQYNREFKVLATAMRTMPLMLTNSKMIESQYAFNYLFSLYTDRLEQIWSIVSGVR